MVSCTKKAVFDSNLSRLDGVAILVTSVLSNFLCDACTAADQSRLVEVANAELSAHVLSLASYLGSHPQTRAIIVPPLPRMVPDWFNSYLPCFTSFLINEVTKYGGPQLQMLAPFVALPTSYESDGVHLSAAAGECFIKYVLNGVDQVYPVTNLATTSIASDSLAPAVGVPVNQPPPQGDFFPT